MPDELTCPNSKCKKPNVDTVNIDIFRPTPWYVACDACGSAGPLASTEAEAIRLWKLLGHRDLARMLAEALEVAKQFLWGKVQYVDECAESSEAISQYRTVLDALADAREAHLLPEEENGSG